MNVDVEKETPSEKREIIRFDDNTPSYDYHITSLPDPTYGAADNPDDAFANWFSRPVKVRSYTWAVNTNIFETFNPWTDYFTNSRVINRITNFRNLRCTLKVKFMLNGNSFHYGRAIASYIPLASVDNVTKDRAFFQQDVIAASQRPHIYLDPTMSQAGTLSLPFFYYANTLSIPNEYWTRMGDIIIHGMNVLKHANGGTDPVTVSVFVWAEDLVLSTPTNTSPSALVPQSGLDEYGQGIISKPAAVVSKVAGALTKVPILKPYAMASQIAADAVGNVARLFGYSRPAIPDDIVPYKPVYCGNLANTNVGDSVAKLSLDLKQETTVDSRTVGLDGTDEMSVKSIACRESYLTQFDWSPADTAETLLWNCTVTPMLFDQLVVGPNTEIHMTSMAYATAPFARWRGTIKYRFQVVASAFHKGRLKIVYDPYAAPGTEYNTNYVQIVDLAKQRDFTIEIGWGHPRTWLNTINPGTAALQFNTAALGTTSAGNDNNGILSVFVVNELTTPSSALNDIQVNVFTSACDDFEVADPSGEVLKSLSIYAPQSGVESFPDATKDMEESAPMQNSPLGILASQDTAASLADAVYFGDPITSFRQLLKRYTYYTSHSPNDDNVDVYTVRQSDFPYFRGYSAGGIHNTTLPIDPTPYNFVNTTLLNYLSVGFTGWRGNMRWKAMLTGVRNFRGEGMASVTRLPRYPQALQSFATSGINLTNAGTGNGNERSLQYVNVQDHGFEGTLAVPPTKNNVLEYDLPFYSAIRFNPTKTVNLETSSAFNHVHRIVWTADVDTIDYPYVHCFVAAGDDFSLFFYTGAPVFYYEPILPPASAINGS